MIDGCKFTKIFLTYQILYEVYSEKIRYLADFVVHLQYESITGYGKEAL